MKGIPEELLYVLMFLAIVLFQYLMKRFGPQAPEEPAWDERLEQAAEEVAQTSTASAASAAFAAPAATAATAERFGRGAAPKIAPLRRRYSRASLLGSRRAVQNAVVVATILGPCRAFEPHDIRQ